MKGEAKGSLDATNRDVHRLLSRSRLVDARVLPDLPSSVVVLSKERNRVSVRVRGRKNERKRSTRTHSKLGGKIDSISIPSTLHPLSKPDLRLLVLVARRRIAEIPRKRRPNASTQVDLELSTRRRFSFLSTHMKFPPAATNASRSSKLFSLSIPPNQWLQASPMDIDPRQRGETRIDAVGERIR